MIRDLLKDAANLIAVLALCGAVALLALGMVPEPLPI